MQLLPGKSVSCAVPDVHYIAVLHDIVFPLQPQRAFSAGVCLRARSKQLVPMDSFSTDEMLLKIRMDCAARCLGARFALHRPGAAFVLTYGKERNQSQ